MKRLGRDVQSDEYVLFWGRSSLLLAVGSCSFYSKFPEVAQRFGNNKLALNLWVVKC